MSCPALQSKLMSMETDNVEGQFGRDAFKQLKDLVQQQHAWARQRLEQMVAVRATMSTLTNDKSMKNSDLTHFLNHYVPQSLQDFMPEGAGQASRTKEGKGTRGGFCCGAVKAWPFSWLWLLIVAFPGCTVV